MRRKLDGHLRASSEGQLLLDFGQVPVLRHRVGTNTVVTLAEQILGFRLASGAADAAERVRDEALRMDQFGPDQGNGGQQNARWIAAGRRDQESVFDLLAIQFRQAVDGLRQEVWRGMIVAVELAV